MKNENVESCPTSEDLKDKVALILSVSRAKTYHQCPRRYYYNYIEKLPKLDWDHFDLGTLVHGVLEFFHKELRNDESLSGVNIKKLMKESFQKQRLKMEKGTKEHPPIVFKNEVLLEARDLLREYMDNLTLKGIGSNILELEDEFEIKLSEKYLIKGVVDRLDIDHDGTYHIKDYKTNKNPKYMEPSQLQAYGIYLLNKFPNITKYRGSYIMMRFNGMLISYDFTIEDVEKEKRKLIECADLITEEERWIARPSNLCDWCDFKSVCLNTW